MEVEASPTINKELQLIGEGSFGKVYLYHQRYVIKQTTFAREEYYFLKQLHTRFTPKPLFCLDEWLVMSYLEGESLDHLHEALSFLERLSLLWTMGYLIFKMHRMKFCHNDIKPANIIRCGRHFYLIDFGSAKHYGAKGPRFGSKRYASKAYIEGRDMSWRTDLYAFIQTYQELSKHRFIPFLLSMLLHMKRWYLLVGCGFLLVRPLAYGVLIGLDMHAYARHIYPHLSYGYPMPTHFSDWEHLVDDGLLDLYSTTYIERCFDALNHYYSKESYTLQTSFYLKGYHNDLYSYKRELSRLDEDDRLIAMEDFSLSSKQFQELYLYEAFVTDQLAYKKRLYAKLLPSELKGQLAYEIFCMGVYNEGYLHQSHQMIQKDERLKAEIKRTMEQWPPNA